MTRRAELTGFGATRTAWAKTHAPATNPELAPGCCFGAVVESEGSRVHTWAGVQYDERGRVYSCIRYFPGGTDERTAMFLLHREDLPSDVRPDFTVAESGCKIVQFRSAAPGRLFGEEWGAVTVALSSGSDRPYTTRRATSATLILATPGTRQSLAEPGARSSPPAASRVSTVLVNDAVMQNSDTSVTVMAPRRHLDFAAPSP